ncbi:MAG: hypothetical protein JNL97_08005, partial [Verrucomicrobiales bacterium]|nr:hypothetical protein [Verrucomicrobiales bacterium]
YNYWSDGEWTEGRLDLGLYAGQRVRLGFLFAAGDTQNWDDTGTGWYIDDLRIETGPLPELPLAEGFEDPSSLERWTVDFGVWEIGSPTNGLVQPHGGTQCLATRLEGRYTDIRLSRIASASFVVPAADQLPRLRFWHWWNCSYGDAGRVQISTDDGATWSNLSPGYGDNGSGYNYWSDGEWTEGRLDLAPYAGRRVRLGFLFAAGDTQNWDDTGTGWYIDDLRIETGPLPELPRLEGFEDPSASDRWTADFGVWEIGTPTDALVPPHSGTRCLATRLTGRYADTRLSRVASAPFVVPSANQQPRLRFWHWWSFSYGDAGRVQISTDDGATWGNLSPAYGDDGSGANFDSKGEWKRESLPLSAYVGQRVRLGFLFVAADSQNWDDTGAGWYVDDLMIQTGNIGLAEMPNRAVDEKTPISFQANAVGADASSILTYLLPWAPEGASIDPETGLFSWLPGERHGPGVYRIPVQIVDYGNDEANEMVTVAITVNEVNEQPWLLPAALAVEPGQHLRFPLFAGDRDLPVNPLEFRMSGAPVGATLTTNTGVLEWSVPTGEASGTYRIEVALADHGSPGYTTNNTVVLTVTPNATYGVSVRHLGAADLEFTIHDATPGADYVLQHATAFLDPVTWVSASETVPAWTPTLPPEDYMDWSTWEEFVQAKLQRTPWTDVVRVTATRVPYVFVHTIPNLKGERIGLFRVSRVSR